MAERKDGGQAFPSNTVITSGEGLTADMDGMTLRDYFAGQTLAGMDCSEWSEKNFPIMAAWIWKVADAMIVARETKEEPCSPKSS